MPCCRGDSNVEDDQFKREELVNLESQQKVTVPTSNRVYVFTILVFGISVLLLAAAFGYMVSRGRNNSFGPLKGVNGGIAKLPTIQDRPPIYLNPRSDAIGAGDVPVDSKTFSFYCTRGKIKVEFLADRTIQFSLGDEENWANTSLYVWEVGGDTEPDPRHSFEINRVGFTGTFRLADPTTQTLEFGPGAGVCEPVQIPKAWREKIE
eukprot:194930_1